MPMAALDSYDPLLATLLKRRDLTKEEDAEIFLNPNYELHTHDPFLLPDMEKAVERISRAVKENERIAIWGDYDTDGIPAGVILHDLFKKAGCTNFENYIPHRTLEGFGLNEQGIDDLAVRGAKLIITVDCGITDAAHVDYAKGSGIDTIITDHHLPGNVLPSAYAIVDPKLPNSKYPFDMLCGAGVAFKLIQALVEKGALGITPGWEKWLLDMVGLATLSDMVPLRGENRVFARYGLTVLRKSRRPGLQQLLRKLRIDQRTLSEDDIGFMIAPRINAASRMGVPYDAFRLLATDDAAEAESLATHLDKINNERKGHVAAMVKEAKHRLEAQNEMKPIIVLGSIDWRPSLLGLVANTLMESYQRPAVVWGRGEGAVIKGSCRASGSVNVVSLMSSINDLFIDTGGHAYAGGFSMEDTNVHLLEDALLTAYENLDQSMTADASVNIDAELSLDAVNRETCKLLDQLSPFGEGNPKPLFAFRNVHIASVRQFGKEANHLELVLEEGGAKKKAIAFFATPEQFSKHPADDMHVDILGTIECSFFGGKTEIRLRLVDVC
jgi:single-stranded-DNA-specific exonuclease